MRKQFLNKSEAIIKEYFMYSNWTLRGLLHLVIVSINFDRSFHE